MTTKKTLGIGTLAAAILGALAFQVSAMPANMQIVGKANPPIGHYEFCRTYAGECAGSQVDSGPMQLTEALWKSILEVNYTVNSSITPLTDLEIYGVEERWAYPRSVGDCEDFALLKRKMLIDRGVDPADLLMTVVLQPNGEGHAVLTIRTDHGDFILDNMRNKVLLWSETEYTYLKRQSSSQPSRWVKLQDGRAGAVGSVSQ
ncbi:MULTISPECIES: transglutaminase-like cysteine peptidase [Rhizobiaceae]|jgi:predicted transglutaminase-like cysteine proteinase|uniref:Transglutaminase-like cysteine peptidase n=1 Tax=Peteryoungia algae TaxID=2919917 RepID=A0ABT0D1H9_9HYPH|nr:MULTISPECIES: transglutaminase-like cysteine peptidase [unclassified Rhizobium]MCC8934170.1 transglutaminase-like cysteine peptidase [Rhizobium sp. 'Codium 1']MCJ8239231.1 transglutaminase-like cysteine peptidase [Rhizobium sp. SSM4.3]